MIFETILLNRLFKSNNFASIKPRVLQDKIIFAKTDNYKISSTGTLAKVQPSDVFVSQQTVESFFDCKTANVGNLLFLGMELQFAF